jgi:F-type H+-transporting ATPase subunit a
VIAAFLGLVPLESGGFEAPGVHSFDLPPLYDGAPGWLNKYVLMATVSVILILVFWVVMARKNSLVPSKSQFIGETAYFFVRNGIARDMIGHDFRRFLPFLIAIFSFVLLNNLWGIFPLTLLPTPSHVGWAYLKHTVLPSGVPKAMWPIIIPLEFFSNIIVRPMTLSLRLFANMFAGHLLVLVFVLGGEYLVLHSDSIVNNVAGVVAWIFSMAIFALEIFVQCLQAFIFTVLTAVYISSAAAEEH